MSRFSKWTWGAAAVVLGTSLALLAARRQEEGSLVVETREEEIYDGPDGAKIGTLLKGVQVKKLDQEGKWVHLQVEGWIWGPALEGFTGESAPAPAPGSPRPPLQEHLPKIKRLINETYGVFYGLSLDADLQQVVVRLRVKDIGREALERRQMGVQREVLAILAGKLEFEGIRVESNRPDGSGQVGIEIAQTSAEAIRRYAQGQVEEWKAHTRLSVDGGKTWSR